MPCPYKAGNPLLGALHAITGAWPAIACMGNCMPCPSTTGIPP